MNGVKIREKTMRGPAVHMLVVSGNRSATDLGASSPRTMCMTVIREKASVAATPWVARTSKGPGSPTKAWMKMAARVLSPTQPRPSEARVIPSWVAEM